jgi:ribose/xylose/arabinose/galactoside ABC-type transport system permease subunit
MPSPLSSSVEPPWGGGGGGSVFGTLAGVVALGVIDNLLNLFNVQSYYQQIFKGVIILVAVLARRKQQ